FLGVRTAQSFKLPLLQRTQQFRLNLDWNVPDFVQKQRTPVSKLKPSDLLRDRTGECASLVPKELTLKQSGGNGGTIELYKGPVLTATAIVDHTGKYILDARCKFLHNCGRGHACVSKSRVSLITSFRVLYGMHSRICGKQSW